MFERRVLAVARLLILAITAVIGIDVAASHYRGGSVSYEVSDTGQVDLDVFTVWRSGSVVQPSFNVCTAPGGSGCFAAFSWIATTNPYATGTELGGGGYVVRRDRFRYNLSGRPAGTYYAHFLSGARVTGIRNAPEGSFSLQSKIIYKGNGAGKANASPSMAPATIDIIARGFAYTQNLNSSDPEGTPVNYQFLGGTSGGGSAAPDYGPSTDIPGISLDSIGTVSISAANTATLLTGRWVYKTRVTDGSGATSERDVLVVVQDALGNNPPTLNFIGTKNVSVGTTLTFPVVATDPDPSQNMTIRSRQLPAGAALPQVSSNTGTASTSFSWTPPPGSEGTYRVYVEAFDQHTTPLIDSEVVTINVTGANDPPTLDSIGHRSIANGGTLTFTISGSDPDTSQTVSYAAFFLPAGASFNPSTRTFTWTPSPSQYDGVYTGVNFCISDSGVPSLSDCEAINITVGAGNQAPAFTAIPAKTVAVGDTLTFNVVANDANTTQTISLALGSCGMPSGASFSPASGNSSVTSQFSWTPTAAQVGTRPVCFRAEDNGAPILSADLSVDITVIANRAPVASDQSASTAEDSPLPLTLGASDPDGDTLAWIITSGPSHGALSGTAPNLTYTPAAHYWGPDAFSFKVNDGSVDSNVATVSITVTAVNDPPQAGAGTNATDEDQAVDGALSATDADGDALTHSVVSNPSKGTVTITNAATGAYTYVPNANENGSDSFTFKANDGTTDSNTATVSITIAPVNDAPVAADGNLSTDEDTSANGTLSATDADGDALTYSVVSDGTKGTVTITNPATGAYTYVPNADENGSDSFTFKVNDGGGDSNEASVSVTILPVNDEPVLDGIGPRSVDELEPLSFVIAASDVDTGDALTYSATNLPTGAVFDGDTRQFTWTPTEEQGPGSFEVTFAVSDGTLSDSEVVTISVAEVNTAPTLGSIGNQNVDEETLLTFTATATDGDDPSNTFTYALVGAPAGASIDASTGVFTWTPGEDQGPDDYTFTVKVTDSGSPALSSEETITVSVAEVNVAPVLAAIGPQSGDELEVLSFSISGSDADLPANTLTYNATNLPTGAVFDGETRQFTWTPTEEQGPGSFDVTFAVSDGTLSDSEVVTLTIREVNTAPTLATIADQNVDEETTLSFTATATDGDLPANTFTYSLVSAPAGASIGATSGVFSWTPTEAQGPGSYTFTVKVTDSGSPALSDEQAITVTVAEVNVAPVLGGISGDTKPWNETFTFDADATDADLPENTLTFSLSGAPSGADINPSTGVFTWTPTCEQIASHTFSVIVTDNGSPVLSDSQSVTLTVTRRATTLVYSGVTAGQYSDPAAVTATLRDAATNAALSGKTVTFDLASLSASDDTDGSGIAESSILLDLDPTLSGYLIESDFAGDDCYAPSSDSDAFDVTQEDARVTYTGALFVGTACTTCGNAAVTLAATVEGATAAGLDPDTGDILNATLTFINRENNQVLCTAPLGLVGSDPELATGTCTWDANIGNSDSDDFTIGMVVGGWYVRNAAEEDTVVTISKPIAANFITGGGYLVLQSSAGQYAGDRDTKNNFGFSVKYNKSGKNLQGRINTLVRSGGRTYQIKGNVMSSLAVQTNAGTATFNGKASITDITDPLNPVAVDGNATLQVTMTDMGEPGSNDSIGITVWNKQGGLWFASAWDGTKTAEQALDGGNLVVR
jgi:VCBS repeat-containing protein